MAKLGDICIKIDNIDSSYDEMIEYIDISSVDNNKKKITSTQTIDYSEAPSRAKQLIQNGDILVSNVRPNLNAVALVDTETNKTLVASTGYTVIRCNNKAYNKYVFFFCQYSGFVDLLTQQATGASYPAVNAGIIKSTSIPLPPLETQKQIAANLDKVTHTIDLCNNILEKLDLLVKARFVEMFGEPLTNPMKWKKVNISTVVGGKVSNGFFAKRDEYCDNGKVKVLGVANIVNRMYSNTEELPQTNGTDADIEKYGVKYGDMLFCRSSLVATGIGKASVVPKEVPSNVLFECHVIRLPLDLTKCVPEFMQVLSTTDYFRNQVISQSKTATMTTIGQDGILKTEIILPPLELQKQFLMFVEQTDKSKSAVKQVLEKAETLKKALMQEYFG